VVRPADGLLSLPAGHSSHPASAGSFALVFSFPAGQYAHDDDPADENWSAPHLTQWLAPEPPAYRPATQSTHPVLSGVPLAPANLPVGHAAHEPAPAPDTLPAGQFLHEAVPAAPANFPAPH